MAEAGEVWFESAHRPLYARVWGSGEPLVLLHGSHLNTHGCFAALAAQLDGTFQVIAPDVRGFGRSVSPEPRSHTWEQYVADVLALLDHLGLPSATVGGQSFGAGIAVATALRTPERVRALVIAQPAYAGAEVGHTESQKHVWVQGRALLEESEADGLRAAMLRSQADEAGRAWVTVAVAQQQDETSFLAAHRGEMQTVQPFTGLENLRSIDVPVLLIPGDDLGHDPLITEMYAQHLRQVMRARVSTMDPLTWVDDLRGFAPSAARQPVLE